MDNKCMIQYFEWYLPSQSLLWQQAAAQAQKLRDLGFDIIWLPPGYKGAQGANDTGYAVYDTYDLGEFDQKGSVATKYGTRDEYLTAIRTLQKEGISVLLDIVLNQRMGADETELVEAEKFDPENRTHRISTEEQIQAWTKFTFPNRNGKYSAFTWDWSCFTGIDWDQNNKEWAIFQFEGKEWSKDVADEKGNFDYLMGADVDVQSEKVVEELKSWGKWYLETTGADGFRLDALKHIDYSFIEAWVQEMHNISDKELITVGEYWSGNVNELTDYLQESRVQASLFDVPLHMRFRDASTRQGNFIMSELFENTLVARDSSHTVTFVDNHDTQPRQALASWVDEWFKPLAYACILLRQGGLPCVFYGDLYGLRNDGIPSVPGLHRMLMTRKLCAYGEQHDYFDHENIIGWTREGDYEHEHSGCAVLMTDKDGGSKEMYIGKQFAGREFLDITLRELDPVVINKDGSAVFKVPGGSVTVYTTKEIYQEIMVNWP